MSSLILRFNPAETHISSKKHKIPIVKKKLKQLLTQKVAVHGDRIFVNRKIRRNRRYYYHDHRLIDPWNSKYQYTKREWGRELNPIRYLHNNDPECLDFLNTLSKSFEECPPKSPESPIINKEKSKKTTTEIFPKPKKNSKKTEHKRLTPVDSILFHIMYNDF